MGSMSDRVRRIGENEALFREVNEQVESLDAGWGGDGNMHLVCECGELGCIERLTVALEKYQAVRADPARFFVKPGHELPDVEEVVERHEGFNVVRKHEGEPQRIAEQTDSRA
jgi:hypothetical protein